MTTPYYEVNGQGPELVLLHGWGWHSGVWETLLPALTTHYRVICIDLPGFGRSMACASALLLDELILPLLKVAPANAYWLGWSLGGLCATQIAINFPERVRGLVQLANTPYFLEEAGSGWPGMSPNDFRQFVNAVEQDKLSALTRFISLQAQGDSQANHVQRLLRAQLDSHGLPGDDALQGGLKILQQTDLRSKLKQITCPVLQCWGENDVVVPVACAQAVTQYLPDAKSIVFSQAGHAPFLSQPEEFIRSLSQFIDETEVLPS